MAKLVPVQKVEYYNLEGLTEKELMMIKQLCGKVGGCPTNSYRNISDQLYILILSQLPFNTPSMITGSIEAISQKAF